jgi:catechol 2,3-dioxygenase-like lactoylglutathione lyase family enzyme
MSAPLPVSAVHHISHVVRDLDTTRSFYRDLLGFREIKRANFDFAGAWLFNYGVQIHLIENTALEREKGEIKSRADHVALDTDDIAAVERMLSERGIGFKKSVVPETNVTQLFIHDPDGNTVEFGTYPETPPFLD